MGIFGFSLNRSIATVRIGSGMKTWILVVAAAILSVSNHGQGTVLFSTLVPGLVNAPVYGFDRPESRLAFLSPNNLQKRDQAFMYAVVYPGWLC